MSPQVKSDQLSTADLAQAPGARARDTEPTMRDETKENLKAPRDMGVVGSAQASESAPLFSGEEGQQLRAQWDGIQAAFVDEPRRAVENADQLVAAAMKRLAEVFAQERQSLEQQWDRGDQVSTEDLRIAFQRYRSFFTRLLRV
jgi:hypothetical protein